MRKRRGWLPEVESLSTVDLLLQVRGSSPDYQAMPRAWDGRFMLLCCPPRRVGRRTDATASFPVTKKSRKPCTARGPSDEAWTLTPKFGHKRSCNVASRKLRCFKRLQR